MKAAEAVALLQRTGWAVRANPGDSWAEVVADAVARRRNQLSPTSARSGVYSYSAKGEESVSLNITTMLNERIREDRGLTERKFQAIEGDVRGTVTMSGLTM